MTECLQHGVVTGRICDLTAVSSGDGTDTMAWHYQSQRLNSEDRRTDKLQTSSWFFFHLSFTTTSSDRVPNVTANNFKRRSTLGCHPLATSNRFYDSGNCSGVKRVYTSSKWRSHASRYNWCRHLWTRRKCHKCMTTSESRIVVTVNLCYNSFLFVN